MVKSFSRDRILTHWRGKSFPLSLNVKTNFSVVVPSDDHDFGFNILIIPKISIVLHPILSSQFKLLFTPIGVRLIQLRKRISISMVASTEFLEVQNPNPPRKEITVIDKLLDRYLPN